MALQFRMASFYCTITVCLCLQAISSGVLVRAGGNLKHHDCAWIDIRGAGPSIAILTQEFPVGSSLDSIKQLNVSFLYEWLRR